jgi:hypothetical protein
LEGEVEKPLRFDFEEILKMPKAIVSNTMECSGNSRSLLDKKAAGNPWTIGGVGNAVCIFQDLTPCLCDPLPVTPCLHL